MMIFGRIASRGRCLGDGRMGGKYQQKVIALAAQDEVVL